VSNGSLVATVRVRSSSSIGRMPVARGVGVRDHRPHARDVDLGRVDAEVRQLRVARQPLGQVLERERLAGMARDLELGVRHHDQRVDLAPAGAAPGRAHAARVVFRQEALVHQDREHLVEVDAPVRREVRRAVLRAARRGLHRGAAGLAHTPVY
jgi:hypothetical protein